MTKKKKPSKKKVKSPLLPKSKIPTPWTKLPKKLDKYVGMVYKITELDTGMIYIGIKKFWAKRTRKPLKGYKRKRVDYIESDWKTYKTSSAILCPKMIENPDNYKCECVRACETVTELKAWEAYIQLDYYVNGDWSKLYNGLISLKIRIR